MMFLASIVLLLLVTVAEVDGSFAQGADKSVSFRSGQEKDRFRIATALAKELMNPLGVRMDRFVVATDPRREDGVIGWAQIKPLSGKAVRDPASYTARPGSYDLERDVDEQMWEEFEADATIQVPVGLASLPWTPEYRAMEAAVKDRAERRGTLKVQRERETEPLQLWELSSVYVESAFRGRGIGTELVRRVLKRRLETGTVPTRVYLLTLATTVEWYRERFGFEEVYGSDIPSSMALEVMAGNLITMFIGAKLCCMRGTSKTRELCQSDTST